MLTAASMLLKAQENMFGTPLHCQCHKAQSDTLRSQRQPSCLALCCDSARRLSAERPLDLGIAPCPGLAPGLAPAPLRGLRLLLGNMLRASECLRQRNCAKRPHPRLVLISSRCVAQIPAGSQAIPGPFVGCIPRAGIFQGRCHFRGGGSRSRKEMASASTCWAMRAPEPSRPGGIKPHPPLRYQAVAGLFMLVEKVGAARRTHRYAMCPKARPLPFSFILSLFSSSFFSLFSLFSLFFPLPSLELIY